MVDGSKREARAQRKNNRFGEIISGSYAKLLYGFRNRAIAGTTTSTQRRRQTALASASSSTSSTEERIKKGKIMAMANLARRKGYVSGRTLSRAFLGQARLVAASVELKELEDEGPTAQVPQHVEDESSEATIPGPFDIREEVEETQVRQVAAATPELSLEATSEPSAPMMSEDPTTPVLAVDTSPPTTPVLQLTDEEDG
ncbi:hypothetical protein JHK87_012082 [Glycine soja]|nr:hypothetical protein JHK87_012082 [Glycine soja]